MWDPTSSGNWYRLIRDWGLIGGGLALAAGFLAYWAGQIQADATRKSADDQLAANAEKDRMQAHAMARAIYTEVLQVTVGIDRARDLMKQSKEKFVRQLPHETRISDFNEQIAGLILTAKIQEPPLVRALVDKVFIMEEAGASILQLLSVLLQYNNLVETHASRAAKEITYLDPSAPLDHLSGHLDAMGILVKQAEQEIKGLIGENG